MLASMNSATAADASASGATRFITNWMVICPYSRINLGPSGDKVLKKRGSRLPRSGSGGAAGDARECAAWHEPVPRSNREVVPLPIHSSGIWSPEICASGDVLRTLPEESADCCLALRVSGYLMNWRAQGGRFPIDLDRKQDLPLAIGSTLDQPA